MINIEGLSLFLTFVAVGLAFPHTNQDDRYFFPFNNVNHFFSYKPIFDQFSPQKFQPFRKPKIETFMQPATNFCRTAKNERGKCVPAAFCLAHEVKQHTVVLQLRVHHSCSGISRDFVCCPEQREQQPEEEKDPWDLSEDHLDFPEDDPWDFPEKDNPEIPEELRHNRIVHPNRKLLPEDECGSAVMTGDKIIGGEETAVDEFPWMALLLYELPDGEIEPKCGGTLINSRYVITAAHCIQTGRGVQLIQVRLGEYDIRKKVDCRGKLCNDEVEDVDIVDIIKHPQYTTERASNINDIALLRLERPVKSTRFISPICLPLDEVRTRNYDRERLTVAGWGRTYNGGHAEMNPVKLKVRIPVVSSDDCNEQYKKINVTLTNTQMCAGGEKDKDSCQGDSGGPLMAEELVEAQLRWYLTGIVSFGFRPCGLENAAGVYTRVSEYVTWILDNMRD